MATSLRQNQKKKNDQTYNVIFLGSGTVGKTSILNVLMGKKFEEQITVTVGITDIIHRENVNGKNVTFKFLDTAGQERYKAITKMYYKECYAAIFIFSGDNPESLKQAIEHMRQFQNYYQNQNIDSDFVPLSVLVRNKIDLESAITPEQINQANKQIQEYFPNFQSFKNIRLIETSAKTGENIPELLQYIIKSLDEKGAFNQQENNNQSIRISNIPKQEDEEPAKKKPCC